MIIIVSLFVLSLSSAASACRMTNAVSFTTFKTPTAAGQEKPVESYSGIFVATDDCTRTIIASDSDNDAIPACAIQQEGTGYNLIHNPAAAWTQKTDVNECGDMFKDTSGLTPSECWICTTAADDGNSDIEFNTVRIAIVPASTAKPTTCAATPVGMQLVIDGDNVDGFESLLVIDDGCDVQTQEIETEGDGIGCAVLSQDCEAVAVGAEGPFCSNGASNPIALLSTTGSPWVNMAAEKCQTLFKESWDGKDDVASCWVCGGDNEFETVRVAVRKPTGNGTPTAASGTPTTAPTTAPVAATTAAGTSTITTLSIIAISIALVMFA